MSDKLFTLGEDYLVDLNKEELSLIEEYRKIIRRDRGSEGDHDGRKKQRARRELTFIYLYYKYDSDFSSYPEKEKLVESLKASGLPEDYEPFKDEDLMKAIERFQKNQDTRTLNLLRSVRNSVDELTVYYDNLKFGGDAKKVKDYLIGVKNISSIITQLDELETRVKKEMSEDSGIRADANKGLREDRVNRKWEEE